MSNNTYRQRSEAVRLFAEELNASKTEFQKEEEREEYGEKRAPNYALLPTGFEANRVLMMGTLLEVGMVSDSTYRARITDRTGEFFVYANTQYSPEAANTLGNLEPEGDRTELDMAKGEIKQVMVYGKANIFPTKDGENTYVSVDPDRIIVSDIDTRDQWAAITANQTLDRLEALASGEAPLQAEAHSAYDFDYDGFLESLEEVVSDLEETVGLDVSAEAEQADQAEASEETAA